MTLGYMVQSTWHRNGRCLVTVTYFVWRLFTVVGANMWAEHPLDVIRKGIWDVVLLADKEAYAIRPLHIS